MPTFSLHQSDCLEVLKTLPDNSVDSIVTDPPYGLSKEPDMAEVLRHWLAGDDYQHKGGGFMGKSWDSFVPGPAVWREVLRVLKPGGHLLAFFGTRTQDMGTLAIRVAGFEIRDCIFWCYGSGFPKSRNIAEHDMEGENAERWQGWGSALKPALEPITVARKPLAKGLTIAENVLAHGTGALNIDGCRVATSDSTIRPNGPIGYHGGGAGGVGGSESGRWPANLLHDGSPEVVALFPAQAGAAAPVLKRNGDKFRNSHGTFAGNSDEAGSSYHGDSGSAARFFYCAKTSKKDRGEGNTHPTVKPTDLMAYLCRLVTPPGGTVLDPFMGSGSTGKACMREGFNFIGCELSEAYAAIARARIKNANNQPDEEPRSMQEELFK